MLDKRNAYAVASTSLVGASSCCKSCNEVVLDCLFNHSTIDLLFSTILGESEGEVGGKFTPFKI
jgi:hypothetical protein